MNLKETIDIRRILLIRRNNIGDMVCSIPAMKTLRREFPNAHITVLADSANAGIIEGSSFVDMVIVHKKTGGIYRNKYLNCWRLLRRHGKKFDIAIVLQPGYSSTSALLALISMAKIRVGCVPERPHALQFCFNRPVKSCRRWRSFHQVDALLEIIKTIGIKTPVKDITIEIPSEYRSRARGFLAARNTGSRDNVMVINVSANRPSNRWSLERFRETAVLLASEYRIAYILTSTRSDRERALRLADKIGESAHYFETPRIIDFAAVVAESDLLLCGEGGAMHIGASVLTPTISLWGREYYSQRWTPYGSRQFVVNRGRHVNAIPASDILDVIKENRLLR